MQLIVQVVCTDGNSYVVFADGRVYAMGANNRWQCTEIEALANDTTGCVSQKHLVLSNEEKRRLDEIKEEKLRNPHKKVELPAAPGDDFAAIPVIPVEVRELIADIQRQRPVRRACELQLIDMKLISKILVRHVSAGPEHALACSTGYQVFGWGDNNYG